MARVDGGGGYFFFLPRGGWGSACEGRPFGGDGGSMSRSERSGLVAFGGEWTQ